MYYKGTFWYFMYAVRAHMVIIIGGQFLSINNGLLSLRRTCIVFIFILNNNNFPSFHPQNDRIRAIFFFIFLGNVLTYVTQDFRVDSTCGLYIIRRTKRIWSINKCLQNLQFILYSLKIKGLLYFARYYRRDLLRYYSYAHCEYIFCPALMLRCEFFVNYAFEQTSFPTVLMLDIRKKKKKTTPVGCQIVNSKIQN